MTPPDLSIADARRIVLDAVRPLSHERVAVTRARGRVLAQEVCARGDVPPFASSAMDGYAAQPGPADRRLLVVGESRAGAPASRPPQDGEALRISTGAALPDPALAVIPVEQAREADGWVTLKQDARAGRHVREAGEDMHADQSVLTAGTRLAAAELGVAVAAGHDHLVCSRSPRVAVVCSGDELRPPGQDLGPGQIHNSNAITLSALAESAGAQVVSNEVVVDEAARTRAAFVAALERCDVLLISGGVSVGEHDHVKHALRTLGVEQRFWRVALRPGRPTWFGIRDDKLVFGLPGNPVSAMVTFLLFARWALAALQGASTAVERQAATLATALPRIYDRDDAVRVRVTETGEGRVATPTGPQGSHQLTSMLRAHALLVVEAGTGVLAGGSRVLVEPI